MYDLLAIGEYDVLNDCGENATQQCAYLGLDPESTGKTLKTYKSEPKEIFTSITYEQYTRTAWAGPAANGRYLVPVAVAVGAIRA